MFEWSEEDLMVQSALRDFIDKEIRPLQDELESGTLPPYDITRKLLSTFGVDAMAADALNKELAAEEAGEKRSGSGEGGAGMASSMFLILNMELAGVCLGLVGSMGVSMGLTASTIRSKGTLAQKKRWLPGLVTMETVAPGPSPSRTPAPMPSAA